MLLYQQPVLLNAMDLNDSACTGLLYPVSWLNTSGKFFPNFVSGDLIFFSTKNREKKGIRELFRFLVKKLEKNRKFITDVQADATQFR